MKKRSKTLTVKQAAEWRTPRPRNLLTVEQAAKKSGKTEDTIWRLLRTRKLAGVKVEGRWRIWAKELLSPPERLSNDELRMVRNLSGFLSNAHPTMIREMIRRGLFRRGMVLYEVEKVEASALAIVRDSEQPGATPDPAALAEARKVLEITRRVPFHEREPRIRTPMQQFFHVIFGDEKKTRKADGDPKPLPEVASVADTSDDDAAFRKYQEWLQTEFQPSPYDNFGR